MRILVLLLLMATMTACGFEQVDEGYRGIKTRWGKVEGDPLSPGLYFYNPVSSDIFEILVREQKLTLKEVAYTRDTQMVAVEIAVTVYPKPEKIGEIYSQFGKHWEQVTLAPAVQGSVKDVVGRYVADDLVSKREEATRDALKEVQSALETRGIIATRLDFINLDFADEYEKAVEAKVVAIQQALEAKNKTVQVEEQAKQKIIAAKSEAEAMRIKTQALAQSQSLVDYEAVQRWDGKLPQYMFGSTIPMLNLESLKQ